jgi:hypothetical protein
VERVERLELGSQRKELDLTPDLLHIYAMKLKGVLSNIFASPAFTCTKDPLTTNKSTKEN